MVPSTEAFLLSLSLSISISLSSFSYRSSMCNMQEHMHLSLQIKLDTYVSVCVDTLETYRHTSAHQIDFRSIRYWGFIGWFNNTNSMWINAWKKFDAFVRVSSELCSVSLLYATIAKLSHRQLFHSIGMDHSTKPRSEWWILNQPPPPLLNFDITYILFRAYRIHYGRMLVLIMHDIAFWPQGRSVHPLLK